MNNKRIYQRYECDIKIKLYHKDLEQDILLHGKGINISQGGILFYSLASLKIDTKCSVYFKLKEESKLIIKEGKVLRVNDPDKSKFTFVKKTENIYAMQFNNILSIEELNKLIN